MSKKGFTLVELLITISIIAILSAVGLVAYSTISKQGRDSKRQSDLRSVQSALEQYYADQLFYPASIPSFSGSFTNQTGNPNPPISKTYLNNFPSDPTARSQYSYSALPSSPACDNTTPATRCTGYCLYASLENVPNPTPAPPTGCNYPAGYNYAVTTP